MPSQALDTPTQSCWTRAKASVTVFFTSARAHSDTRRYSDSGMAIGRRSRAPHARFLKPPAPSGLSNTTSLLAQSQSAVSSPTSPVSTWLTKVSSGSSAARSPSVSVGRRQRRWSLVRPETPAATPLRMRRSTPTKMSRDTWMGAGRALSTLAEMGLPTGAGGCSSSMMRKVALQKVAAADCTSAAAALPSSPSDTSLHTRRTRLGGSVRGSSGSASGCGGAAGSGGAAAGAAAGGGDCGGSSSWTASAMGASAPPSPKPAPSSAASGRRTSSPRGAPRCCSLARWRNKQATASTKLPLTSWRSWCASQVSRRRRAAFALSGSSSAALSARRMRRPKTAKEARALPAHACARGVAAVPKAQRAREKAARAVARRPRGRNITVSVPGSRTRSRFMSANSSNRFESKAAVLGSEDIYLHNRMVGPLSSKITFLLRYVTSANASRESGFAAAAALLASPRPPRPRLSPGGPS